QRSMWWAAWAITPTSWSSVASPPRARSTSSPARPSSRRPTLDQSEVQIVRDDTSTVNGDGRVPMLDVTNLQAGWGRKRVVFDVDIHVYEGEVVGILGHNGSGKSTTIKAVLGTNPAQGGRIRYGGRDVTR